MPGTILRNITGPFISLPFQTPPGHSLALSLAGTSFIATLECTLDFDSTDWVQAGPTFTAATFYNSPVGAVKYRLNIASGTVISAQYSTAPVQVIQTGTGVDFTTSIAAAQSTANSAQGGTAANKSAIGNLTLAALSTKAAADGPQLVDGNRWKSQATGSAVVDGGTIVAGSGCIWVREYSGDISASWFGAVGDGITDDYAALQAWATAGKNLGYSVRLFLPPRTNYRVSQALHFEGEYVILDLQGIIRPFGAYTGYLVDIGPLSTALGANIQSVSVFGAGIWQKRVSVENLTVDCEWKSRGVIFRLIDHFENSRVYVRRSLGTAVSIDRCREGDWYGLKMFHCKQGTDRAILDFYDNDVAGDTNNTMSFYGLEVVWCFGRYVSFDSNPTFAASGGYFPPRFINFYGAHIEDIFKTGQVFELAGSPGFPADNVLFPNPTIDRIWIRRGYNINWFGGTLNSGDISTGSVVRLGDSTLTTKVQRVRFSNTNIFAFDGATGASIIKAEACDEIDEASINFWVAPTLRRISYGAASNIIDPTASIDSSAAFTAWLARPNHGPLAPGSIKVPLGIKIPDGIQARGNGRANTILLAAGALSNVRVVTTTPSVLPVAPASAFYAQAGDSLSDLSIEGAGAGSACVGLAVYGSYKTVRNVSIRNFTGGTGVEFGYINCFANTLDGFEIYGNDVGVAFPAANSNLGERIVLSRGTVFNNLYNFTFGAADWFVTLDNVSSDYPNNAHFATTSPLSVTMIGGHIEGIRPLVFGQNANQNVGTLTMIGTTLVQGDGIGGFKDWRTLTWNELFPAAASTFCVGTLILRDCRDGAAKARVHRVLTSYVPPAVPVIGTVYTNISAAVMGVSAAGTLSPGDLLLRVNGNVVSQVGSDGNTRQTIVGEVPPGATWGFEKAGTAVINSVAYLFKP